MMRPIEIIVGHHCAAGRLRRAKKNKIEEKEKENKRGAYQRMSNRVSCGLCTLICLLYFVCCSDK